MARSPQLLQRSLHELLHQEKFVSTGLRYSCQLQRFCAPPIVDLVLGYTLNDCFRPQCSACTLVQFLAEALVAT